MELVRKGLTSRVYQGNKADGGQEVENAFGSGGQGQAQFLPANEIMIATRLSLYDQLSERPGLPKNTIVPPLRSIICL